MGRPKALLRPCGYETAIRQRRCARNNAHIIAAGERCLVFKEQMNKKCYCLPCAREILDRGREQVEDLLRAL